MAGGEEQSESCETLTLGKSEPSEINEDGEEEEGEAEIKELERELKEMAEKILDSRSTVPVRLMDAFSSHMAARRPVVATARITCGLSSGARKYGAFGWRTALTDYFNGLFGKLKV